MWRNHPNFLRLAMKISLPNILKYIQGKTNRFWSYFRARFNRGRISVKCTIFQTKKIKNETISKKIHQKKESCIWFVWVSWVLSSFSFFLRFFIQNVFLTIFYSKFWKPFFFFFFFFFWIYLPTLRSNRASKYLESVFISIHQAGSKHIKSHFVLHHRVIN